MSGVPYRGDWRVKEYKAYTEKLEGYNARLENLVEALSETIVRMKEQVAMQTVNASLGPMAKGLAPAAVKNYADDWNKRSALYWP